MIAKEFVLSILSVLFFTTNVSAQFYNPYYGYQSNSCTNPQFAQYVNSTWIMTPDVWYVSLGNKVSRLHMAELLQRKLLTYEDDFSGMCAKTVVGRPDVYQGYYYGFSGLNAYYRCGASQTRMGFVDCDYSNTGLQKHLDITSHYGAYTDNRNFNIIVKCYPNGETGWLATSISKGLTSEETQIVLNHIQRLGFDPSDVVSMYGPNCP